ncbi:MAG: enoyl-[acyl-carrier-protein] reductase FabK [Candidatus Nealsonbacteria bacterium]|nr:enoyl-[acyl-carrier-protein] reductase FabK [Candidatus Nealsonbacteria bacterium]
MFKNNITKVLGIKYPVIQGGMAGISDADLVAAVSEAGGLGVLGAGFLPADWLKEEVVKTKKMTDKPFGVNLLMRNPNVPEMVKIVIEEKVPAVFTGAGNPLSLFPHLKKAGIKIIPVVGLARLARKMEVNEADAVVVEGLESGGHIGRETTFSLVAQTKDKLEKIPLIAAGGIYDGKTAAAAFMLGADGIQMGTRFLASKECQAHDNYKKAILEASDEDVIVVGRFTGYPVRAIRNKLTEKMEKFEKQNPFPEEIRADRFSSSKIESGNIDYAPLLCGLSAGGISDIKTCKEIVEGTMEEAIKIIKEKAEEL